MALTPNLKRSGLLAVAGGRPYDGIMNTVTNELLDAKLETIETRMDCRVASIERLVADSIAATNETRQDIKNLKMSMVVTGIAVVLGIAALNATVLSNMLAAFESGKNTASAQAEVKQQAEQTAALIKKMQQDLGVQRSETDAKP